MLLQLSLNKLILSDQCLPHARCQHTIICCFITFYLIYILDTVNHLALCCFIQLPSNNNNFSVFLTVCPEEEINCFVPSVLSGLVLKKLFYDRNYCCIVIRKCLLLWGHSHPSLILKRSSILS
jgi:hypothetical protein